MLYPAELRALAGLIAAAALVVTLAGAAWAQPAPAVVQDAAVAGGDVVMPDGRRARLAGVLVPVDAVSAATEALGTWLDRGPFMLEHGPQPLDRHGRLRATLRRGDETAQGALVRVGHAVVNPAVAVPDDQLRAWLAEEGRARAAALGLWRANAVGPFESVDVPVRDGGFALVEGRILRVARAREFVYANFGDDLRTDLTLRAAAPSGRKAARDGIDLQALEGRRVRARGFLVENNGPMIEITHRLQVEVLP